MGPICRPAQGRIRVGRGKTVVTVAVDRGLKYLAGDLYAT